MEDMIVRTRVTAASGETREGGEALLQEWQPHQGTQLWLDIEGEISPAMHEQLLRLGCHEVAITDIQRVRQPPKLHAFDHNTFILFRGIIQLDDDLVLKPQQIGFFVGEHYLVTIHRGVSLSINRVWSESPDAAPALSPGSLALRVMDYASNRYLDKILEFEERLGELEDSLLRRPSDTARNCASCAAFSTTTPAWWRRSCRRSRVTWAPGTTKTCTCGARCWTAASACSA